MLENNIKYFIIIGENILNYHGDITDYYEEWFDNIGDVWIVGINFRDFVIKEFENYNIDYYIAFKGEFDKFPWRKLIPNQLFEKINNIITKRLEI